MNPGSSEGGSKVTQRDVFVAVVSLLVAAIGAGMFASCTGGGAETAGEQPPAPAESPHPTDGGDAENGGDAADGGDAENGRGNGDAVESGGENENGDDGAGAPDGPEIVHLSDLDAFTGTVTSGSADLLGETYPNSIATSYSCLDDTFGYALDTHWSTFEASLGVSSDAHPADVYQVYVYVDGEQVGPRHDMTKFDLEELTVDVDGAIELLLRVDQDRCLDGRAIFGDARLTR